MPSVSSDTSMKKYDWREQNARMHRDETLLTWGLGVVGGVGGAKILQMANPVGPEHLQWRINADIIEGSACLYRAGRLILDSFSAGATPGNWMRNSQIVACLIAAGILFVDASVAIGLKTMTGI